MKEKVEVTCLLRSLRLLKSAYFAFSVEASRGPSVLRRMSRVALEILDPSCLDASKLSLLVRLQRSL
jgi:hypothetical protein